MKRAAVLVTLIGILGVVGAVIVRDAPASGMKHTSAAQQNAANVAALQAQVADLAGQVRVLSAQVKTIKAQLAKQHDYNLAIYDSEACITVLTADALQGTWMLIDKLAPAGTTYFGTMSPLDDKGACKGFKGVTRAMLTAPPGLQGFAPMVAWFEG
jgi:hypothetical protein